MSLFGNIEEKLVDEERRIVEKINTVKKVVGPGLITGAADDDSSGVGTYSAVGAAYGLLLNWLVLVTLPMMIAVQEACGRIGLVTQKGLAGVIKQNYSRAVLLSVCFILVLANTINIGADLGAMAASAKLVFPTTPAPLWALFFATLIIFLEVFVAYRRYSSILKFLTLSLLAYFITAFMTVDNWPEVLRSIFTFHLQFDKNFIFLIVGFLGTTISPYLFFWETSEEVEEGIIKGLYNKSKMALMKIWPHEIKSMRLDTISGMVFSQATAFFIMVTTAMTLHKAGILEIPDAAAAAAALKPLAGDFASLVFAVGIIGVGLLGIPVLAGSAAYALSEAFDWEEGLSKHFKEAKGFYSVMGLAVVIGLVISLLGLDPIKTLVYAAVLNGIISVPLIFMIALVSSKESIMGRFKSGALSKLFLWITFIFCLLAVLILLWLSLAG